MDRETVKRVLDETEKALEVQLGETDIIGTADAPDFNEWRKTVRYLRQKRDELRRVLAADPEPAAATVMVSTTGPVDPEAFLEDVIKAAKNHLDRMPDASPAPGPPLAHDGLPFPPCPFQAKLFGQLNDPDWTITAWVGKTFVAHRPSGEATEILPASICMRYHRKPAASTAPEAHPARRPEKTLGETVRFTRKPPATSHPERIGVCWENVSPRPIAQMFNDRPGIALTSAVGLTSFAQVMEAISNGYLVKVTPDWPHGADGEPLPPPPFRGYVQWMGEAGREVEVCRMDSHSCSFQIGEGIGSCFHDRVTPIRERGPYPWNLAPAPPRPYPWSLAPAPPVQETKETRPAAIAINTLLAGGSAGWEPPEVVGPGVEKFVLDLYAFVRDWYKSPESPVYSQISWRQRAGELLRRISE